MKQAHSTKTPTNKVKTPDDECGDRLIHKSTYYCQYGSCSSFEYHDGAFRANQKDAGVDMTVHNHSDHNLDKITVNIKNNTLIGMFIHNYNQIQSWATLARFDNNYIKNHVQK